MELPEDFILELTQSQPRLFGFLFKRLANHDQTKEVLQRTNIVLCRKAGNFKLGTNFFAWAVSIAHFQLLAYRKEQVRERLVFSDEVFHILDKQQHEENDGLGSARERLKICLDQMPKANRDMLSQRYDENLTNLQIASALDKSVNAVRLKLHRLRMELLKCVEQRLNEERV